MLKKINIAIDGPSGAGKSSISKAISEIMNYTFINTGSVYRAIAFYAKKQNVDWYNEKEVVNLLKNNIFKMDKNENIYLEDKNITYVIRNEDISKGASIIAKYTKVREYVVDFVQKITKKGKGYIMDGRDTTFKIMPHAELKIYLTASPEERATRRQIQNKLLGFKTDYNEILKEVKERDYQDTHRKTDPLHIVKDAIVIDCSELTFDEVVNKIIDLINKKVKNVK